MNDTTFDADNLERFCAELRPGDPPDGQRYLRQAFTRYYQALFENDAKSQLELLLCANLEIGFHEQTRLQPEIAESLDAAFVDPQEFKAPPDQSDLSLSRLPGAPALIPDAPVSAAQPV